MRKIEGVVFAAGTMGRVRGVSFRRNRSMVLGEMAVFVLNVQPGLNAAQIKDRINAAARQYQFNNSTLGWILARTPGVIVVRKTPSHSATYELETEREADLPEATQDRLMKSLELFHPPTGDDGD